MASLFPADADGLRAYADQLRERFERLQSDSRALHDRARAVRVTERSLDGLVTATVGPRGELVNLELDPRVLRRQDARALSELITETVHRAADKAQEEVVEIFEPLVPAGQMRAQLRGDLDASLWPLVSDGDSP